RDSGRLRHVPHHARLRVAEPPAALGIRGTDAATLRWRGQAAEVWRDAPAAARGGLWRGGPHLSPPARLAPHIQHAPPGRLSPPDRIGPIRPNAPPGPASPIPELYRQSQGIPSLARMNFVDLKTWLPDDLLVKADRMSMATSLELRVPFLDHKVVEFALRLPS